MEDVFGPYSPGSPSTEQAMQDGDQTAAINPRKRQGDTRHHTLDNDAASLTPLFDDVLNDMLDADFERDDETKQEYVAMKEAALKEKGKVSANFAEARRLGYAHAPSAPPSALSSGVGDSDAHVAKTKKQFVPIVADRLSARRPTHSFLTQRG